MPRATDELLKTHSVIHKLMEEFKPENPRFPALTKTLRRTVAAHAWFEETLLYPALKANPGHDGGLTRELAEEHGRIGRLLQDLERIPAGRHGEIGTAAGTVRAELEAHLKREREELYPAAEELLDARVLEAILREMERRKSEVRDLTPGGAAPGGR